jgi:hypothetical protein
LVAREIIDHGEIISLLSEEGDQVKGIGEKMIRGYKVDIMDVVSLNHKKIVPDPYVPVTGGSSPKWGPTWATRS